jgi:hypothetical protein
MPEPLCSANSSVFDPSTDLDRIADCDARFACCNRQTPPASPPRPKTIQLEPVYVYGDAGQGAQELVRRHAAQASSTCQAEKRNALASCALITGGVLTTIAGAPTLVGTAAGVVATFGLSVQCGRDLQSILECNETSRSKAEIASDCDARGGVQVSGVSQNEVVCLVR